MKWNGKCDNDPEKDFPIQDEVWDFEGKERKFEITYRDIGLGYMLDARELGKEEGYMFSAFDANSPYLALGKIRDKMHRALSTRHLIKRHGEWSIFHDTLKGRISCEDGRAVFVVDGVPLSLEDFNRIVLTYEGWQFSLKFADSSEEV